jgi:inorganic pyrophosphatase
MGDDELSGLLSRLFQAHPWHGVPAHEGDPDLLTAFIEIVPTDTVKYELHKPSGHLHVDRPQRFSSICPTLYGFIPQTYCAERVGARCADRVGGGPYEGDGDPLDICVLTEKAIAHGNLFVRVRPIGGLRMVDGNQADDKIVAVLHDDVAWGHLRELGEVPPGIVERLRHYFLSYKRRPDDDDAVRRVRIAEVYDRSEAGEIVRRSIADYRAHYGAPEERLSQLKRLLG